MRSMALSWVCFRDGTKTRQLAWSGSLSTCSCRATKHGLAIAIILEPKCPTSKPCTDRSNGTGLTCGWKAKRLCPVAPSQSPKSFALARQQASPTMRAPPLPALASSCDPMYRMRLITTSSVGPWPPPPSRWSSSAIKSPTSCTALRCRHRRLSMSKCSAEAHTRSHFSSSLRSDAPSPVRSPTARPSPPAEEGAPRRARQSLYVASTTGGLAQTYTTLLGREAPAAHASRTDRKIANSAQIVFPDPEGAQRSKLSSVSKSCVKAWVCTGLKCEPTFESYRAVKRLSLSCATGRGCRSSSSVGGGLRWGIKRLRKEMGSEASAWSQRSLTTRKKYCGGMGSKRGTVNDTRCSSEAYCSLSKKGSACRMLSPSTSSTRMWNKSA
mmetsp:Transcript_9864/g.22612  ORF Transcript_9864/g.22612 Transcript_9864/m.22612 type:complete len:383 (+) Transcript_9864:2044-3192(+)